MLRIQLQDLKSMTRERIGKFEFELPRPEHPEKFKILDLKTILSRAQDATTGTEDSGTSSVQSPPISVEALPASLTSRVSTVGSETLQRCCASLSENGTDAVSHELQLLRDAIKDQNTISFLKDTTISIEERNDRLKQYLLSALIVRHSVRPFLNESNIDKFVKAINEAHLVDNGTNCNAGLEFGTACLETNAGFFGVLFHELEHRTNRTTQAVDEGRCDLASFKMFKLIAGDDRKLFDRLHREYTKATFYEQENNFAYNTLPGISIDGHTTARAFTQSLIETTESKGFQLYDIVDAVYSSWADISEVIDPKPTLLKDTEPDFRVFVDRFLPDVNQKLESTGLQLAAYSEIEVLESEKDDKAKLAGMRNILSRLDTAVSKIDPSLEPITGKLSDDDLLTLITVSPQVSRRLAELKEELRKRLEAGVNVMDPSIDPLLAKPIDIELSIDKRLSADSREALSGMRKRVELLVKAHVKLFPSFDEREFDSVVKGVTNDEGIKEGGLRFEFIPRVCEKNNPTLSNPKTSQH